MNPTSVRGCLKGVMTSLYDVDVASVINHC